ncbi:MAG: TrkA family potassium uptake protein [Fimbriimonadaceae bacterium]|nr:TrkA family potassium uptake protein [Fimbriimonadaceae bacterium]QYK55334.1 MAG: TrkA family potassium uptake protein [Fimbriimonadaceae bacterium]
MNVVIMGCGRSGATLALELSSRGHQVTLIERNPEALRRLGKSYPCRIVIGSGLDEDILVKAGVDTADAFMAMTRGDNTNLMAAQIVQRRYKVPKVVVKVADPMRAEAYRKLGLFCINASALIAGICRDWLIGEPFDTIDAYNVLSPEFQFEVT